MKIRPVVTAILAVLSLAVMAPSAWAGTYEVEACLNDARSDAWVPLVTNGATNVAAECPSDPALPGAGLRVFSTPDANTPGPLYSFGRFLLSAPSGAKIVRVRGNGSATSGGGWTAGIFDYTNGKWLWCGAGCTSATEPEINTTNFQSDAVALLVACEANGCLRNSSTPYGSIQVKSLRVSIFDSSAPTMKIQPSGLASPGWKSGEQTLTVSASDNVGIRTVDVYVDGALLRTANIRTGCDAHLVVPCPNGEGFANVSLVALSSGAHQLRTVVTDSAYNTTEERQTILVDNTAPGAPGAVTVENDEGWQTRNEFALRVSPSDEVQAAPITGYGYELCAAKADGSASTDCTTSRTVSSDPSAISGVSVPREGAWVARVWQIDAAGNANRGSAREATLRYDATAPTGTIALPSADRPTEVQVTTQDGQSSLSGGSVELRREGSPTWRALDTTLTPGGLAARLPDEELADGRYALRALVSDAAGNSRVIDRDVVDAPAGVSLPVRLATRLVAGKSVRVRTKRGKRRNKLVARPRLSSRRAIRLYGRLTGPDKAGLAGRVVAVMQRTDRPGAEWAAVKRVTASKTGRFNVLLHSGPRREVQFRYDGTETVRAATSFVALRVRASTSLRPNRRSVVNGEDIVFRGRLAGKPLPTGSKLIQLQAYTRGRWATFANPRANPKTGLWSYRYRFSATRGTVRYRIRAVVPKDATYPYDTGRSRVVGVRVRGL